MTRSTRNRQPGGAKTSSAGGEPRRSARRPVLAGVSTESILESVSDGVFTVDSRWRITSFNRAAEQITGVARRDAIGRQCSDVFRASMCENECALRRTIESGKPLVNRTAFIVDASGRRIPISVSTALLRDREGRIVGGAETFRDLTLIEELRKEIVGRFSIGDMVSRSALMHRVLDVARQIAESGSAVLLEGETGTGKELLARAIHGMSHRRDGPFVAVNCGALPDTLLESELFGYKAGAFTGAVRDKPGRFARAAGGTLFLDEIAEVSQALQVRLLRVLQDLVYEPLGGVEPVRADVRVIAAANRNLARQVERGAFRQDLYYRLNVVRLELPPLRRRREDIPLLVEHFIGRFNARQGRHVPGMGGEAMALLMAHDFPGNVRELENVVEHAFVLCGDGPIEPVHLPEELRGRLAPPATPGEMSASRRAAEAQAIREALARNGFNRLAAARSLGIHRSTLFRKARALGIRVQAPPRDRNASKDR